MGRNGTEIGSQRSVLLEGVAAFQQAVELNAKVTVNEALVEMSNRLNGEELGETKNGVLLENEFKNQYLEMECEGGSCVIFPDRVFEDEGVIEFAKRRTTEQRGERISSVRSKATSRFIRLNSFYETVFNIPKDATDEYKQSHPDLSRNIGNAAIKLEEINTLLDMGDPSSIELAEEYLNIWQSGMADEVIDAATQRLDECRSSKITKVADLDEEKKTQRELILAAKKQREDDNRALAHGVRVGSKKVVVREDIKPKKQKKSK